MPNEYDALLETPSAQSSEYDALLTQPKPTEQKGGAVSGVIAGIGRALNPINLVKGALDLGQPSDISQIVHYGSALKDIVFGKSPDEAIGRNIPELQSEREAVFGRQGAREQAAALTGIGLQAGMLALPFVHGRLRDIAFPKPPSEAPLAEEAATQPIGGIESAKEPISETSPVSTVERQPTQQETAVQPQAGDTRETPAEVTQTVAPTVPTPEPTLPRDLRGAKPRYNYGSKGFELQFDSDVDKASYIAAQKVKSKADARYVQFVSDATGLSEQQIREHGQKVRADIKSQAKDSSEGTLKIGRVTSEHIPSPQTPVSGEQIQSQVTPEEVSVPTETTTAQPLTQTPIQSGTFGDEVKKLGGTIVQGRIHTADIWGTKVSLGSNNKFLTVFNKDGTQTRIPATVENLSSLTQKEVKTGEEKVQRSDEGEGREGVLGNVPPEQPKVSDEPRPLDVGGPRSTDTYRGVNVAGEHLYVTQEGQYFRLRNDRATTHARGKGGEPYRDYGGDLAPVSEGGQPTTASTKPKETVAAAAPPTEPPSAAPVQTSSTEPHVSAIANRFTQERSKQGEIGEISPGQGHSTEELVQRGLTMSPEEVNQHVSDLMQGTGDIVKQGQAVRAEESRLSQRSNQASRELEADPNNMNKKLAADNAFKDLTDFHNGPVATLKNKWHQTGMEMQGEIPVDLSTFNGMREAWFKDLGTMPPPEVEPMLRETAKKVSTANGEADASIAKVGESIDKVTKGRKLPDYEQVRNNILERLKGRTPCN